MPVTMQQVVAEIDREEPDYTAFARLGAEAVPFLKIIAAASDPLKAAKATYAASTIGGPGAAELLTTASDHHDPQVRVAVAQGLKNMARAAPTPLVLKVLGDADQGVRKLALRTAVILDRTAFSKRIAELAASDPAPHLRDAAADVVKRIAVKVPIRKLAATGRRTVAKKAKPK